MEKQIQINNKNIFYTIEGAGNVLVFIHGFIESKEIWTDFSKNLSSDFKVVCIDLPGHGRSDMLAPEQPLDLQASAIKAVLDAENIDKCVIVGHSMGGYISLQFMHDNPAMVAGVGLFHSHAAIDSESSIEFRNRSLEILKTNRKGFITQFFPGLFAEGNAEHFSEDIRGMIERGEKMSVEAIIAAQIAMRDRSSRLELIAKTKAPVMFIIGKYDTKSALQKVLAQTIIPLHAEVLVVPCGHMGYLENKKETQEFIRSFTGHCFA